MRDSTNVKGQVYGTVVRCPCVKLHINRARFVFVLWSATFGMTHDVDILAQEFEM